MRTVFAVPPFDPKKGSVQNSQNRQYQRFKDDTFIFPVVPSLFLTMLLTEPNQEVILVDCVAEKLNDVEFGRIIVDMKPDYIVFEANTMIVKRYYEVINGLKEHLPQIKLILCGYGHN